MELKRPSEPEVFIPESQRELPSTHAPKSRWVAIAIITVLWHLFLLWFSSDIRPPQPRAERTVINTVDPAKLDAMRRQQRGLILSKDPPPKEKLPENRDARYDSDRNRVVPREQRAARTNVVPNPAGGGAKTDGRSAAPSAPESAAPESAAPKIDLSNLGALSNLKKNAGMKPRENSPQGGRPGEVGDGADQAVIDPNLPVGAENLLNTRESVYYTFYARIFGTIGPIWQSRIREMAQQKVPPGQYLTQVEVVLDAKGNYVETRFMKTSGIEEFDRSVKASWEQIRYFPNPPSSLVGRDGYIRMGWNFLVHVDNSMSWNYRSPSRVY